MSDHRCHAKKCMVSTSPKVLMCVKHWRMVPYSLQKEVWAHYKQGQEVDKNPSREYLDAARAAINAVAEKEDQK